jgi:signal transduction histidine kinase
MSSEWFIVLNAEGTVLGVNEEAAAGWVGGRIEERADVPAEIRRVAGEIRRQLFKSADPMAQASLTLTSPSRSVRLLALYAVPLRRVPTDLRALLELTLEVMDQQARQLEVSLTLDVDSNMPQVLLLDPGKIAWTITTLVGNALRFVRRGTRTRPGGSIDVRARYDAAALHVILDVQDDGKGIPADKLAHMLEPAPGQLYASGLGLSLVRDVVAAHGGTVHLESSTEADRSGTRVRLTLPCP